MNKKEFENHAKPGDLVHIVQNTGDRLSRNSIYIGIYVPDKDDSFYVRSQESFDGFVKNDRPFMGFGAGSGVLYDRIDQVKVIKSAHEVAQLGKDSFGDGADVAYLDYFGQFE